MRGGEREESGIFKDYRNFSKLWSGTGSGLGPIKCIRLTHVGGKHEQQFFSVNPTNTKTRRSSVFLIFSTKNNSKLHYQIAAAAALALAALDSFH